MTTLPPIDIATLSAITPGTFVHDGGNNIVYLASATVGVRGSTAGNAERFVSSDGTHPSAQGVDYLCMRLAQGTRAGVMAL